MKLLGYKIIICWYIHKKFKIEGELPAFNINWHELKTS
jgi:hypothetical protein